MNEEQIKVFKITPSGDSRFDVWYAKLDDSGWKGALSAIEESLEMQLQEHEWEDVRCVIECVTMTQKEYEDICNNE